MINVAVVGASGYIGGELTKLLANHQKVNISAATSRKFAKQKVHRVHPNLRGLDLRFTDDLEGLDLDLVFMAVPHGVSMDLIDDYFEDSRVIDLSADFRVTQDLYEEYYETHERPDLIEEAVYGLPEIHRDEIKNADLVANPGCNATSAVLGLYPFRNDNIEEAVVDLKVSSSAGGRRDNIMSSHPERSSVVRAYEEYHHRHEAEVIQETGIQGEFSVHSVDMVRGLLATIHIEMETEKPDLYKKFQEYSNEHFIRFVKEKGGIQRNPDPKYILGSNFVDVGFAHDERNDRVVVFSALDNLIKGGAGQAVQNMNIMYGFDEITGLKKFPVYPV